MYIMLLFLDFCASYSNVFVVGYYLGLRLTCTHQAKFKIVYLGFSSEVLGRKVAFFIYNLVCLKMKFKIINYESYSGGYLLKISLLKICRQSNFVDFLMLRITVSK